MTLQYLDLPSFADFGTFQLLSWRIVVQSQGFLVIIGWNIIITILFWPSQLWFLASTRCAAQSTLAGWITTRRKGEYFMFFSILTREGMHECIRIIGWNTPTTSFIIEFCRINTPRIWKLKRFLWISWLRNMNQQEKSIEGRKLSIRRCWKLARPVEGAGKLKFVNNLGPESARIHLSGREREREKWNIYQEEKEKRNKSFDFETNREGCCSLS